MEERFEMRLLLLAAAPPKHSMLPLRFQHFVWVGVVTPWFREGPAVVFQ